MTGTSITGKYYGIITYNKNTLHMHVSSITISNVYTLFSVRTLWKSTYLTHYRQAIHVRTTSVNKK